MNLKECYDTLGGNYEDTKQRLCKDEMIQKFIIRFLKDTNFFQLCQAIADEDYEQAFMDAHTLKGLCLNLGFQRLGESAGNLTEFLRDSKTREMDKEKCNELLNHVKNDYKITQNAIEEFKASLPEDVL